MNIEVAVRAFGARKSEYNYSFFRAVAQSGSALPWGGRGPGFESRRPDKFLKESLRAAKPIPAERVIRIGRGRSEGANPGGFLGEINF